MKTIAIVLGAVALSVAGAAAQDQPPPGGAFAAVHAACEKDVQTFCGDTQPRTPERMKCMRDKRDKFSQPCKDALAKLPQNMPPKP